jgi:hypothetical protein
LATWARNPDSNGNPQRIEAHLLECERIEQAFDAILESAGQCDISKRTIQEQVWAVVERTVAEIELVHQKLGEFAVKSARQMGSHS